MSSLGTLGFTSINVVGTATSTGQSTNLKFTLTGVANQAPVIGPLADQTVPWNNTLTFT